MVLFMQNKKFHKNMVIGNSIFSELFSEVHQRVWYYNLCEFHKTLQLKEVLKRKIAPKR